MSNNDRSREGALKFMDYLSQKGLMTPATARSRKAALGKVLSVLDENEAADVTSLDLDDAMTRFSNLHGQNYTPQSLQVYKSRAKSSLEDFETYLENPLGFRPNINKRAVKDSKSSKKNTNTSSVIEERISNEPQASKPKVTHDFVNPTILPIPIRADVTVRIQGLPFDLTSQEAGKIAAVVKAMAMPE